MSREFSYGQISKCLNLQARLIVAAMAIALLLGPSKAWSQVQMCGLHSDVVIMIDRTSSIDTTELQIQINAAKALLGYFADAQVRPRVAIGSFNIRTLDRARIESAGQFTAHLTADYGQDGVPGTRLYAVLNGMNSTSGRTDLSVPIQVAQAELDANALSNHRYIILISDGNASEPGCLYSCTCQSSRDATNAAANAAEAAGSQLFAVRYSGPDDICNQAASIDFMQNEVASQPTFFYQANADGSNLSSIFEQIASNLGCNDQDPCTHDTCNLDTNQCEFVIVDSDSDSVPDCIDACPGDALKSSPGQCGCGVSDIDSDRDGLADCLDACPSDPLKVAPGTCGCGAPELDSDGDSVLDCHDQCPYSSAKTNPGVCGCNSEDLDSDGDGAFDCIDMCPHDPSLINDIDSDGNGVPDCIQCTIVDVTVERGALKLGPERLKTLARKALGKLIRAAKRSNRLALASRLARSSSHARKVMDKTIRRCTQSLDQLPDIIKVCSDSLVCKSVDNTQAIQNYTEGVLDLANQALRVVSRATRPVYGNVTLARKKTKAYAKTVRDTRKMLLEKAAGLPKRMSFCTDG